jgi:probable HAF family extracellular repeat protein
LWENGVVIDLDTLVGDGWHFAMEINNHGQIVGYSPLAEGDRHGFCWQNGEMIDLGTLGGLSSSARSINDCGIVAGKAQLPNGEFHACLWEDGRITDLGTLGSSGSSAAAINNSGQIVGEAQMNSYPSHAFVWHDGTIYDLNDCVPPDFDWELSRAIDINNLGQILALGLQADESRYFLLTPVTSDVIEMPGLCGATGSGGDDEELAPNDVSAGEDEGAFGEEVGDDDDIGDDESAEDEDTGTSGEDISDDHGSPSAGSVKAREQHLCGIGVSTILPLILLGAGAMKGTGVQDAVLRGSASTRHSCR